MKSALLLVDFFFNLVFSLHNMTLTLQLETQSILICHVLMSKG